MDEVSEKEVTQFLINNIGNRLTEELANGFLGKLKSIYASQKDREQSADTTSMENKLNPKNVKPEKIKRV